jgi:penicillin-binding protein 1A
MGLGIIGITPLQLSRAFATFANEGREVTPIAIRSIEDRNGRVVMDLERDLRVRQRRSGEGIQIVSPQNAYVMTSILKKTIELGTLQYGTNSGGKFMLTDENGSRFRMPAAGKTGTTQNWSDAWAVGYTPYYTTAIWFGFDKPGNSLGVTLTGATLAGPIWGDYMRDIHAGLPFRDFVRPARGLVDVTVCTKSGLLKTQACGNNSITLTFLAGTQPHQYCDYHQSGENRGERPDALSSIWSGVYSVGTENLVKSLSLPSLNLDDLPQRPAERDRGAPAAADQAEETGEGEALPSFNPLLE